MVIQRWQTVFLLLASIFVIVFCFVPVGALTDQAGDTSIVTPAGYTPYLILNLVAAALLLIAIFMFSNTRRQRSITLIAMLLIVVSIGIGVYFICSAASASSVSAGSFGAGSILLPAALLAAIIAYRLILSDEKLLKSYDRLR